MLSLALDRTFIEMRAGSHLPAHQSDNGKDVLHETQMLMVNINDQRSDRIDNLEIVAYISGKKSLFMVSIYSRSFVGQVVFLMINFVLNFSSRLLLTLSYF